ncbi:MAG: hypothetical protein VCC19_05450, partial [Myxococcota bacterium]
IGQSEGTSFTVEAQFKDVTDYSDNIYVQYEWVWGLDGSYADGEMSGKEEREEWLDASGAACHYKSRRSYAAVKLKTKKIPERGGDIVASDDQLGLGALFAGAGSGSGESMSHEALISFLDQFRAGEALGEASLGAWIEVSDVACVKGGLRTVQQREGMHARLLEARLKELGATPTFEVPQVVYDQTMQSAGDPNKSDPEKVADFVKQFPDVDAAIQPILDIADKLDHDPETQFMLRTIAQDERSTLEFLQDACQLLNG